jgi:MFS family permease
LAKASRTGSPLLPIFLIVLVDVLGLTIILPLLPFYAESFGASATQVGLLVSTYAFCQLIAGPILGKMSDQTGRKPLLIVSQIGTFIGFLVLASAQALWVVFLSRVIDGLTAGNLSLAQAYIADVTEPKDRAKSFAVIGISFGIGFLIGPGISGFLAQYGYVYPILVAAGLSFASILCTTFLLPGTRPDPEAAAGPAGKRLGVFDWGGYVQYFRRPGLGRLLFEFLCFAVFFSLSISGFALYAQARYTWNGKPFGPREVGYVMAYAGFLGIILQGMLMGRLVKWMGERKLVWTGFLASSAACTALGWTRTVGQLLTANTFNSYGSGVIRPAVTALITHKAERNEQGVVLGLTQSLTSVAQIVSPVIAGALIDRGWLAAWACVTGAAALVGFAISMGGE